MRSQPRAHLSSGSSLCQAGNLSLCVHLGSLLRVHGGQDIRHHRSLRPHLLHVTGCTGALAGCRHEECTTLMIAYVILMIGERGGGGIKASAILRDVRT